MTIQYKEQESPKGIAHAFLIAEEFLDNKCCALILGDNIFYGSGFISLLREHTSPGGAVIFAAPVQDPNRYGVVEFDDQKNVISIEEKPIQPKSNYAVPGLYFYDNDVVKIAENIEPSDRGEYEITAVNQSYLERKRLKVEVLNRGVAWLDTGTFASLNEASTFVRMTEERQNTKIGCIEEVAYHSKFITRIKLLSLADKYAKSGYGDYLKSVAN